MQRSQIGPRKDDAVAVDDQNLDAHSKATYSVAEG
jgi:hypothetical protein